MELLLVNIYIAAIIVLICVTVAFLLAQLLEDNSVMDIFYGPIYLATAFFTIAFTNSYGLLPAIIIACLSVWSMRLGVRIFLKNLGKPEDARYAVWRQDWMQKGRWYFLVRSYLQINVLQGLVILTILLPFIISITAKHQLTQPFVWLGLLVFAFGLIYESLADWQLDQFVYKKKTGKTDKTLMTEGLFKYSRRPNYFGESLIWWGLAIMVLPLPFGWLALISPITITYIVTKITGPMLEAVFLKKYPEEYKAYMASTPYFLPDFRK